MHFLHISQKGQGGLSFVFKCNNPESTSERTFWWGYELLSGEQKGTLWGMNWHSKEIFCLTNVSGFVLKRKWNSFWLNAQFIIFLIAPSQEQSDLTGHCGVRLSIRLVNCPSVCTWTVTKIFPIFKISSVFNFDKPKCVLSHSEELCFLSIYLFVNLPNEKIWLK